jgi:hypothetical protein
VSRTSLSIAAALVLCAAGCSDAERNEAKLFLDRVEPMEGDGHTPTPAAVTALGRLAFSSDRVRAVRDACVTMYEAVIEAEALHAEARRRVEALERVRAAARDGGTVDPSEPRAIEDAIRQSTTAVERARQARPACQDGIAGLRANYRER